MRAGVRRIQYVLGSPDGRGPVRRLLSLFSLRSAQSVILGFLFAIAVGTLLLMLPAASAPGHRTSLVDALFTATSAVCVTGLVVQDTGTHFSLGGQLVILALIQAGGLGIMTASLSLFALTVRQLDVRRRAAMQDALDYDTLAGVRSLGRFILLMTLGFEAAGAVLLFAAWHGRFQSPVSAAWHAAFHSVSAFCNAGFSTFGDSLVRFRAEPFTNLVVCALIVGGGLGFLVIRDMLLEAREHLAPARTAQHKSRVQTKTVLSVTVLLILGGAALLYALERRGALAGATRTEGLLAALFQSVTARTAGFNTVDIGRLSASSLLALMALMFIGGSPGSAAGGIKTTTVAALWASVSANLRQRSVAEIYHRTIPAEVVQKAVTVLCVSLLIVLGFAGALLYLERRPFLDVLFETVSAFGTVGLSTGLTPNLSPAGRVLVTALMFVGRLGPLTIAYAVVPKRTPARYEYAEERIMIG